MLQGLLHAHSGLRWIVLLLIIVNVINALGGLSGNKVFTDRDKKLSLFALIFTHLQALLGIALYFLDKSKVQFNENTMGNDVIRFYTVEHTLMMLIAVILVTLGNRSAKAGKVKSVFWYYFIALVLILAAIPWPFRDLGAGWF
jgi:hypothetical protein